VIIICGSGLTVKNKIIFIFIVFSIFAVCVLPGCINGNRGETMSHNELSYVDQPLLSPSGNYEAAIEKFDNDGVMSYRIYIVDVNDKDAKYEVDLIFRARDSNFAFWADEEDILWGYSGDIGAFF
jgi:hypothetical protein